MRDGVCCHLRGVGIGKVEDLSAIIVVKEVPVESDLEYARVRREKQWDETEKQRNRDTD